MLIERRLLDEDISLNDTSQLIYERLSLGKGILALDVDGVFLDGGTIDCRDKFTDPRFREILPYLDENYLLRLITARGASVIPTIRNLANFPLQLDGPHLLEDGHGFYIGNELHPTVSEEHQHFFSSLKQYVHTDTKFRPSWEQVKNESGTFCWGDPRWQGQYTGSLWTKFSSFNETGEYLENVVRKFANEHQAAIDIRPGFQEQNNLAWLRIAKADTNKATYLNTIGMPDVYICDGPNDRATVAAMKPDILLPYMNNPHGLVVALMASPDAYSQDMKWVYDHADIVIQNPQKLAQVLTNLKQIHARHGASI